MTFSEGKIDSNGFLYIKRISTWRETMCDKTKLRHCGDNCRWFGEPQGSGPYTLYLCGETVNFTTFTDERS
jgi:hypothetical protein